MLDSLLLLPLALIGGAAAQSFVTTNGGRFSLDGKDFRFAGSNAYYWPFGNNQADVEIGMKAGLEAGLTVFRTWGFNDANATYNPNGLPLYGQGNEQTVFQRFSPGGEVEINLAPLDLVVDAAEKTGMKLFIALTNNWADYGGMDVYTVNHGFRFHDDFYREPVLKQAYKNYVQKVVSRYADSPAIFAWELANEGRCGADGTRNLPESGNCTPELLLEWTAEMSTFIKSVDPNHLVTLGGEGGFNRVSDDHFYNGGDGTDFDAELALPNVDFGVFHSYPDWWSKTVAWTSQWIRDHAAAGKTAGKPIVHEEYGWMTNEARQAALGKTAPETRLEVLGEWQAIHLEEEIAGGMYWQFGTNKYSYGRNHDDGFTIFLEDAEAQTLVVDHAASVNSLQS
ncbi:mannan endo-1,4-beta-mannosidase [Plectosphaerella plurivora]|uniref:mannan endo-1,4-beta-mannosidase n=1 Tax=Plectosphaerella plurivora TaxID=936078 RepID=A0A9P9A7Z9_9PEZI|nr:mannan endo-1,4-beta-mannosidase [Plectosphaerella plurivora]